MHTSLLWRARSASIKSKVVFLVAASLPFAACAGLDGVDAQDPVVPERVVSLVPSVTETLFALGLGERVVGISDFDHYPPETENLPRVGALVNPNIERIFQLQPDLVFTYESQALLRERLTEAGIRQHTVVSGNVAQILESIRSVGRAMGADAQGIRLSNQIRQALDEIRRQRGDHRPRVLLAHSREVGTVGAFYTGGSLSYLNELIDIGGGRNIFDDVKENVFQPSLEEVLDRAPEVIIELLPTVANPAVQIEQRLEDWRRLESVPAVRDGRIHVLVGDHLLLTGPRLQLAAVEIAAAIRGETRE